MGLDTKRGVGRGQTGQARCFRWSNAPGDASACEQHEQDHCHPSDRFHVGCSSVAVQWVQGTPLVPVGEGITRMALLSEVIWRESLTRV
jgi:hypothetical protein